MKVGSVPFTVMLLLSAVTVMTRLPTVIGTVVCSPMVVSDSYFAEIVAEPAFSALTVADAPVPVTCSTLGSLEVQVQLPVPVPASVTEAVSVKLSP